MGIAVLVSVGMDSELGDKFAIKLCHKDRPDRRRASSEDSRRCERHKRVLFVKTVVGGKIDKTVEIPYGHCEVGLWYRCRAHEATGLSIRQMKLLFAGAPLPDDRRHSGLQVGSTLHLVVPAQEPRA